MTNLEGKQALARKLNIDYADIANNDQFSDADLQEWLQAGLFKAWDHALWDFCEEIFTGTISGSSIAYPHNATSGSVFLMRIGGKEFKKIKYQDLLKLLEDNPVATDRRWSEFKRTIYVNTNAFTAGAAYQLFGKGMAPKLTADGDLLPFSPDTDDKEHSGNNAIVDLAYAEALESKKLNDSAGAELQREKAFGTLNVLWSTFAESRATEQTQGRPMFDVPDFFGNGVSGSESSF